MVIIDDVGALIADPEDTPTESSAPESGVASEMTGVALIECLLRDHVDTLRAIVDDIKEDLPSRFASGMFQLFMVETVFLRSVGDHMTLFSQRVGVSEVDADRWNELRKMWEVMHLSTFLPDEVHNVSNQ